MIPSRWQTLFVASTFVFGVVACGQEAVIGPDGAPAKPGYTYCSSPDGDRLCNGSCGACIAPNTCLASGAVGVCLGGMVQEWSNVPCGMATCGDGNLCANISVSVSNDPIVAFGSMSCIDPEIAYLYYLNGHSEAARYADGSIYTGADIPNAPATCPSSSGLPLCGGACGACLFSNEICTGRSPTHPISLCLPDISQHPCQRQDGLTLSPCAGAQSCFTFAVDLASQPVADEFSVWTDTATCVSAANSYPGGAYCTCPM